MQRPPAKRLSFKLDWSLSDPSSRPCGPGWRWEHDQLIMVMMTLIKMVLTGDVENTDNENGHEESQDFDYDLIRFLGRNQGVQRSYLNFSHQGNIHEFVCRFVRSFLILLVIYLIWSMEVLIIFFSAAPRTIFQRAPWLSPPLVVSSFSGLGVLDRL